MTDDSKDPAPADPVPPLPAPASQEPASETNAVSSAPQPPVAPPAVAEPPILATEISASVEPAPTPSVPLRLKILLGVAAAFLLCLLLVVHSYGRAANFGPHQIGMLIGAFGFWPLVIVGIFSIWRRFRTPTHRATIVLWVWGVLIMSQLGILTVQRRAEAKRSSTQSAAADPGDDDNTTETAATKPAKETKSAARILPDVDYDFSPGSSDRLIQLIDSAQEDRYHSIVAGYRRACAQRPDDAVLALERVRFIERFAHAEDTVIDATAADLQEATRYLKSTFPQVPGTVLYKLERAYGPAFEAEAARHVKAIGRWPASDRARFFLLRAQQTEDDNEEERYARQSFEAEPSVQAALLLLGHLPKSPPSDEARRILTHDVFRTARQWEKKQHMDHLFTAGMKERALAVYEELKVESSPLVRNSEMAMRLADAGLIPAARELLGALPVNQWNREHQQRERFRFELKHGTAEDATAAYRTLRSLGFSADPFLRERVNLLLKHPFTGWAWPDLAGLALLGFAALLLVASPLLLVLPIHYWSLLRQRRLGNDALQPARWNLREMSLVLGLLVVAEIAALWALRPDVVHAWWKSTPLRTPDDSERTLLLQQSLTWAAGLLILGLAVWRARAWTIFRRSGWTWGLTLSRSFASALVLRIILLTLLVIWPSIPTDVAKVSSGTHQLCLALIKTVGPLGMLLAIALLVPFIEEVLFRGVMLEAIAKHIPFAWANVIQAALFALVHENYHLFPFYVTFGILCGWLARRSGSLVAPIAVHAINNFTVGLGILALRGAA